jgi:uncharacterized protein (TIGR03790 family)
MRDCRSYPFLAGRVVGWRRLALVLVLALVRYLPAEQPLAPSTIVLYNRGAPDSADLAKFYAQQRGIARDHLIALSCPVQEEISREEYDATIANPLRATFEKHRWWKLRESAEERKSVMATSIRFVAVMKGVPLKIRPSSNPYPGDEPAAGPVTSRNEASVDSELSVLGAFSSQISGATSNPYFQSFRAIADFQNPALLLVCRLDAPTAATVRRMIADTIVAEKNGLWGRAYIDAAHNLSGGLQIGDEWLAEIQQQFRRVGVPVVYEDTPAIFPEGYPMSDCALYYGWYTNNVAGPFMRSDFRFITGAVAVHIHSFSASTLRDPNASWVGPLVSRGAVASLGNVYEPYLSLTTHLNTFNDRLLHGFTFAESAYMATPALSWMNVMVGDPLYRPYASWLQFDATRDVGKSVSEWKMYHDFAVKNVARPVAEYRNLARQVASRASNGAMLEDLGLIEAADGNFAAATGYFQQARACYTKRDDILRAVLEEADGWIKQEKPKRALDVVRSTLRIVPDAPAAVLLRKMEQDLTAPSAAPVVSPTLP